MRAKLSDTTGTTALQSSVALCANEKGAALIVVLVMLLLLTILGATLLATSTTDLQIAGNYRNNQKAFYINDYAFEFLKSDDSAVGLYDVLFDQNMTSTITRNLPADPVTGKVETVNYVVTNIGCLSGAPAGSGSDSDSANAYNVYTIDINATGPNNAAVSTQAGNLYQRGKPCD